MTKILNPEIKNIILNSPFKVIEMPTDVESYQVFFDILARVARTGFYNGHIMRVNTRDVISFIRKINICVDKLMHDRYIPESLISYVEDNSPYRGFKTVGGLYTATNKDLHTYELCYMYSPSPEVFKVLEAKRENINQIWSKLSESGYGKDSVVFLDA